MQSKRRLLVALACLIVAAAAAAVAPTPMDRAANAARPKPIKTQAYTHCAYGPELRHEAKVYVHIFTTIIPRQSGCAFQKRVIRFKPNGAVKNDRVKPVRMDGSTPNGNRPSCLLNPVWQLVNGKIQMENWKTTQVSRNVWISEFLCVVQGTIRASEMPVGIPVSAAFKYTRTLWGSPTIHVATQVQYCKWDGTNCDPPVTLDYRNKTAQPQFKGGPFNATLCVQGTRGMECRADTLF